MWDLSLIANPVLPSPTNWGWMKTSDDAYVPNWSTLPNAPKPCCELVLCKCNKGCVKNCKYNNWHLNVQLYVHVEKNV